MRYILLSYLCICLLCFAMFLILSMNTGFGYVFVQWHGWQLQTNLFVVLGLFLTAILLIYGLWMGVKRIFRRYLQPYQTPKSFAQLHPYEKLGILWLLHAERIEQQQIIESYQPSYVLYPLIRARIALAQQDTLTAKTWLKDQTTPLFELSELLKIDIALLEKDHLGALNRLEFLSVQPLSAWLMPVEQAYQHELREKWFQFAQQCPWWVFKATAQINFDAAQISQWLHALLKYSDDATEAEQHLLYEWYIERKEHVAQYYVEDQIGLLKLMSQYPILDEESFILAQDILQYRFVPEVLYIWLDKGIDVDNVELLDTQVQHWLDQYPAQPSLIFAKWHILQKLQQHDKAQALLRLYPDDPYMAYLRLNDAIESSLDLKNDLKLLMRYTGQNFKFDL